MLLEAGAVASWRNRSGHTPAQTARLHDHKNLAVCLEDVEKAQSEIHRGEGGFPGEDEELLSVADAQPEQEVIGANETEVEPSPEKVNKRQRGDLQDGSHHAKLIAKSQRQPFDPFIEPGADVELHRKSEIEVDMEDLAEEPELQIERISINHFGKIVHRADGEPDDAPPPGTQGVQVNIRGTELPTSRSLRSDESGSVDITSSTKTSKTIKAGLKPEDRAVFVPYVVGTPRNGRLRYKPANS